MRDYIVTKNLRKVYPSPRGDMDTIALDDITLNVVEHEVVSIVGPSGCGKTTLLNLLAGFESPTEGEVIVKGESVGAPSPERGVIFQQAALFPWLSVWDNVTLGPRMRGIPTVQVDRDTREVLSAVDLAGFEKHFPYQLSGGMRQRVQIARVLVASPAVILMDEPFASLDFQTRLIMHEILLRLWVQYQPTIVFITHDVEEAIFLSDRVYVMSHRPGTIKAEVAVPFPKP
jgi:NitT/TauT family transport system ATP-binding protein